MLRLQTTFLVAFSSLLFFSSCLQASSNILNVSMWAQEIPDYIIQKFEKESGIHVNYSSYDSNEIMYAKLHANKNTDYDIVEPSSYYVDRMRHQNMLEVLDRSQLPEFKNIDPTFLNQAYDPGSRYSIPFIWGVTGIAVNKHYFSANEIRKWPDLFNKKYVNQLMMLDDPREAFSIALRMLGYSINDKNPQHIKEAYYKLRELMPNIRLFNTDAVISILIDEDAVLGVAWNGDLAKVYLENPQVEFIYPEDGFEIWVDNFVILKNASHKENAYKFLNFLLRPDIAREVSLAIHYSTANITAKNTMPVNIKNNPILYPPPAILRRGEFEKDIGDETFALYEKYWEQLKMGA